MADFDDDVFDDLDDFGDDQFGDLEDFDDEDAGGVSREDRARMNAFVKKVDENIKILGSRKHPIDQRIDAAHWLGESGEPKAITMLAKVYRKEKDKNLREAAGYSLSMFRALEEALAGDEEEQAHAMTLINAVIMEGKEGKRAPVSPTLLARIRIGLAVSLVVLLALVVIIPGTGTPDGDGDGDLPTLVGGGNGGGDNEVGLALRDIRTLYAETRDDANSLNQQFQLVSGGGEADCEIVFHKPLAYTLPEAVASTNTALVSVVDRLNQVRTDVETARTPFDQACQDAVAITPETLTSSLDTLLGVMVLFNTLETDIATAESAAGVPIPTALPTETPRPTSTPEPTATIDPASYRAHITTLEFMMGQITGQRQPLGLLEQFWTDARDAGITDACVDPIPEIPADYILPADVGALVPDLKAATDQMNLGLALLRSGWTAFENACQNNTLIEQASTGLIASETARAAFDEAANLLNKLP